MKRFAVILFCLLFVSETHAWYLPGWSGKLLDITVEDEIVITDGTDSTTIKQDTETLTFTSPALNDATGNEIAYQFNYTTNKATSGNDTGLEINWTDTASPGNSYPFMYRVDTAAAIWFNRTDIIVQYGNINVMEPSAAMQTTQLRSINNDVTLLVNQSRTFGDPDKGVDIDGGVHTIVDADAAGDSVGLYLDMTVNIEDDADNNHQYKALEIYVTETSVDANTADYLIFAGTNSDADAFTVKPNGDLHSAGSITATGGCCADYVFDKDYNLVSLDELQTSIKELGHLPGMTQGVGKGDSINFNKAIEELIVKVEEQSLYIMELHARIKQLESR